MVKGGGPPVKSRAGSRWDDGTTNLLRSGDERGVFGPSDPRPMGPGRLATDGARATNQPPSPFKGATTT